MKNKTQKGIDILKSFVEKGKDITKKALNTKSFVVPRNDIALNRWDNRLNVLNQSKLGKSSEVFPSAGFDGSLSTMAKSCKSHGRIHSSLNCPDCEKEKESLCKKCGKYLTKAKGSAELHCEPCDKAAMHTPATTAGFPAGGSGTGSMM